MKKIITFFAALAAVLSCSKENPNNYNPVDGTYSVTLTASAPGADTKTTLVDGEGTKYVHWSKGDAIKVLFFPSSSQYSALNGACGELKSTFTNETSEKAYFRTESWSWNDVDMSINNNRSYYKDGIALYPHTADATSSKERGFVSSMTSEVAFVLPETQKAVANNVESGLNFSYAEVSLNNFIETVYHNSTTELKFQNACALIQLTMPDSFGDKKVTRISVQSNDKLPLTGKGAVGLVDSKDGIKYPLNVTISEGANVVLSCVDGFMPQTKYYAVVWPGSHPSGLTIQFVAEDGLIATKTTSGVNLTASRIKPYNFVGEMEFKDPILANPPKVGDFFYSNGTFSTDLDNSKTVVGVVFYVGDPTVDDSTLKKDYPGCTHGLVVGLKAGNGQWLSDKQKVYDWAISNGYHTTQQFTYSGGGVTENDNAKYMWGYNNTCAMKSYAAAKNLTSGIISFVDNYNVSVESASSWYLPSIKEMHLVRSASVKGKVESLGGDSLLKAFYYTSSEENDASYVPYVNFSNGALSDKYKTTNDNVFAIFAF